MVKEFDLCKLNEVMQIWLYTNIDAHSFIPKDYWTGNYDLVKKILPCSEILVCEEEAIYGFIGITDKSYIAGLYVLKEFQRRGYGAELLEECKKRYSILTLDVYAKNTQAINFYKKHGFKLTDVKDNTDTKEVGYTMSNRRLDEQLTL